MFVDLVIFAFRRMLENLKNHALPVLAGFLLFGGAENIKNNTLMFLFCLPRSAREPLK